MKHLGWAVLGVLAVTSLAVAAKAEDSQVKKGDHAAWFSKHDTNGDGKLSLAEFKAAFTNGDANAKFTAADTDKDGFVTPEELKAAHAGEKHGENAKATAK